MANASVEDPVAEAFLNTAKDYHEAAKSLSSLSISGKSPHYFLFAHTIELALKAYIRTHYVPTPLGARGHDLKFLSGQSQSFGLEVSTELANVIELLEEENSKYGFRYFLFASTSRPEITFLEEVTDALMIQVEAKVTSRPSVEDGRVVSKMTVGKPRDIV